MYVGVPTVPPSPPREAQRLTARPADPQGLGQPRGEEGSPSPPTAPQMVAHPLGSHIGWEQPPCPQPPQGTPERILMTR